MARYYSLFEGRHRERLRDRVDRQGRGRVRCVDAWLETDRGVRTETVATGQDVKVVMLLENTTHSPVKNLDAGVGIFTQGNMFTASLSTQEARIAPFEVDRMIRVELVAPRFPLNAGQFYFNCSVRSAFGAYEFEDLVENAGSFTIDYGDYHGVGQSSGGFLSMNQTARVIPVRGSAR